MGFLSDALRPFLALELKQNAIAATVTPYDTGVYSQAHVPTYDWASRQGYMADELVYDCVELRADAAGEPPMVAFKVTDAGEEQIDRAPALELLNRPNPFMGRSRFWATIVMHLDIGGNAYIEKVRNGHGDLVELWLLRPDRVRVLPDPRTFVGGYTYTIGAQTFRLDAEEVIHFKTRHPLDDFYGLPPLAVLAGRVDLDVWTRKFTEAFFRNAGVPAGLLNIQKTMSAQEREDTRRRFRELYGGEQGWHKVLLLDTGPNQAATYTPMGLPLGPSGLALPELNEVNESRILGVYGVPLSLISTLAGSRANRGQTAAESERRSFWQQTMVPMFRDLDSALSAGLRDDFPEFDRFEHDLEKVQALQEDQDAKHARWREDWKAGAVTWKEYRQAIGLREEPDEPGIVLVPTTSSPTPSDQLLEMPAPMLEPLAPQQPGQNGQLPPAAPPPAPAATNGVAH
ncbi:MAG TPA: phage portal protein [Chloroflexota bacterium]|nr:phage portal protein [Chloroflexota bacterium]